MSGASLRVRRVRCPDATRPPSRHARRLTAASRRPAPVLEGATPRRSVPGRTRRPSTRAGGDAPRFAARAGCASRTVSSRHQQERPSRCLLHPVGASALHDGGTAGTERLHALRLQAGSGTTIRLMTTWARAYRRATIVGIRGAHVQHELAPTRPSSSTPGTSSRRGIISSRTCAGDGRTWRRPAAPLRWSPRGRADRLESPSSID
jgi:hypothetical protein